MTLKNQIEMFLKDPDQYDFSFGLELYHTAGPGPDWSYLKQFKYSSPGDQVKKKLVDGLRDLFEVIEPAGDHREDPAGTIHHDQVQPVQLEPQVIRQLRQEQKTLLKRRDKVHAEMCLIAQQPESQQREKELYERAQELMSKIIPRLDRIYASIQRFNETGEIPREESGKDLALYKKINSLRSSLSRFKRLQRANDDQVKAQYYEQKILTVQRKIEAIKEEFSRL
jgi:hypothetical protein